MRLVTDDPAVYWTWVLQVTGVVLAFIALIFCVAFAKIWWDERKKK